MPEGALRKDAEAMLRDLPVKAVRKTAAGRTVRGPGSARQSEAKTAGAEIRGGQSRKP